MIVDPRGAFMPYPKWTYPMRAVWRLVEITVWRLAWKRLFFLRPAILKAFGASLPLRCLISGGVTIYFPWALRIGRSAAISDRVVFYNLAGVTLGDRVVVSQDVYFCGGTHDYTRPNYPLRRLPIHVEDDVWIGAGAFIGPGVRVGQGAVVGARAVVTKDVAPWKVVAGNPARIIKDRQVISY
ncbi:MAG TPA: DapH/DapD/GlmU-related protein [Steroidobacteraceae bacterium]|jgi:putative colanic acid biosynthesis acetyltransferase WcaF